MVKKSKVLKYIQTSDNHFGHRRTPMKHLAANFIKSILTKENSDAHILFIAGDLFDRPVEPGSEDMLVFLTFANDLLNYCYKNDILLRVMEGTPSHDWLQPKMLVYLNNFRENKVDLRYFDVLDIEYIERYNINVLYIPDEWCDDHVELERQIDDKLRERSISQVDIAILHGFFEYQLAGIPYNGFRFDSNYFHRIVKGYIHIGHVHTHSNFDRIIASGSLDRLVHGEEEEKGYIVVTGDEWEFVPNKDAFIYKTLVLTKRDTYSTLDKKISAYPVGSHIRLRMAKDHPFNIGFSEVRLRYPDYHITKKINSELENDRVTDIINEEFNMHEFDFVSVNLKELVIERIKARETLTSTEEEKLDEYLEVFRGSENKEQDLD